MRREQKREIRRSQTVSHTLLIQRNLHAEHLEHIEIDAEAPPNSPRTTDKDHIRNALEGAAQGGVKLHMDNPVVGQGRAACTITCEMPDGKRLVSNTIYDLKDGKIVRQLDVQVMDSE